MPYVDVSNLGRAAVASTTRNLLGYVRPHTRPVATAFAALLGLAFLNLVPPWATKIAVDDFITTKNFTGVFVIVMAMSGMYLARAGLGYLNIYLFAQVSQFVVYEIARDMFHQLVRLSMRYFESQRTGETVSRLTSDVQAVQQTLQGQVLNAGVSLLTLVIYLVVMLTLEWRLTLIVLSVVPLMFVASMVGGRMLRVRYRRVQETVAGMNVAIEENVSGARVSRAFVREDRDARRFQTENRANLQANLNTTSVESVGTPLIEVLSGLSVAAILMYGGWQVTLGTMTTGTLIAFLAYAQIAHQPMSDIVRVNYVIQSGLAAADRIFQFMGIPRDIVNADDAVDVVSSDGEVEFDGVSFSYDGKTPVIRDVSFVAAAGQMVALVGPTGSGKTSLINLVARFYDTDQGRVLLDGHDVRQLTIESLRGKIAYVLQETHLFAGTVNDNILYGNPKASPKEVEVAARASYAHNFIVGLPEGYATLVGDGGLQLSRGQQQRIALARAILANPRILVLDEATSDIDVESEREIQLALERVASGRTTFVIAHRLSTIRNADLVLVMEDGQVVQRGTHQTLIKQPGVYRRLHEADVADAVDASRLDCNNPCGQVGRRGSSDGEAPRR